MEWLWCNHLPKALKREYRTWSTGARAGILQPAPLRWAERLAQQMQCCGTDLMPLRERRQPGSERVHTVGRLVLDEVVVDPEHEKRWMEYCNRHRCDSQSRGSVYDSKAGGPCHCLLMSTAGHLPTPEIQLSLPTFLQLSVASNAGKELTKLLALELQPGTLTGPGIPHTTILNVSSSPNQACAGLLQKKQEICTEMYDMGEYTDAVLMS